MNYTVKCISLWQPWASLCVIPHPLDPARSVKGFETRSWPTSFRGTLFIHAAKRYTREQQEWCYADMIYDALAPHYDSSVSPEFFLCDRLPTGAIIGKIQLVACHRSEAARRFADEYAQAMGDYADGRFAWEIVQPVMFETPIPFPGQQGIFSVPRDVVASALLQQP